jgi:thiamine biosynthesis lipoprotein
LFFNLIRNKPGMMNVKLLPVGLVTLGLTLVGCAPRQPLVLKRTFFRMDTITQLTVVMGDADERQGQRLGDQVDSLLLDWEQRFSQTSQKSEVLALNNRTGDTVSVGAELAWMLGYALRYGDTLGGSFDVTIFPLKELWGFGEQDSALVIPTAASLRAALERVGYGRLKLDSAAQQLHFARPDVVVDVGGIAKGAILVKVDKFLQSQGYRDYLLSAGGDIVVRGRRLDGEVWRVGIQHPRKPSGELLASLSLEGGAIVTSGDYERFYERDGVRYHHIFNAASGQSCTGLQSLTILSDDAIEADILSTGLFCMPVDSIISFVESRSRLECLAVDSAGVSHASRGWAARLQWYR